MNAGDTVRLKSGSELMTIEEIQEGYANCIWMNDKKEIVRDSFSLVILEEDNDDLPVII